MIKINFRFYCCFLLLQLTICQLHGEIRYKNIRFRQLGLTTGLPHSTINAITQDNRGFIWFGTRNGLSRYDGYSIVNYYHNSNDSNSINHNLTNTLYNDSCRNVIWISTDVGICKYDLLTDCFTSYTIKGNKKQDVVFLNTSHNDLLAGCSNGIYKYNDALDSFEPFLFTGESLVIYDMVEDASDYLWISSRRGLERYNLLTDSIVELPSALQPIKGGVHNKVCLVDSSQIWIGKGNQTYVYDFSSGTLRELEHQDKFQRFRCITADRMGNVWLGGEYGIFVYNQNLEMIQEYKQSNSDLSNLNDNPIYCLFRDGADNMWVGTYFGGVNYYINGTDKFAVYPYGNSKNHLSGKAIRQIIAGANDDLYLATEDGGLNHISIDGTITRGNILQDKMKIPTKNVHSLLLNEDKLWMGLLEEDALYYDLKTQQTTILSSASLPATRSVFSIIRDSDGDIWFGGVNNFVQFVKHDGKFRAEERKYAFPYFIFCMASLPDGTIWVGTRRSGIFSMNKHEQTFTHIPTLPLEELFITSIFVDSKERIWVGTNSNGLMELNIAGEIIEVYSEQLIGSNSIKGIIEDNRGRIWFGTDNGLCCMDSDKQITRFTTLDGLPTNQFNYSSACKTAGGELYFGTINGMVSFYPEQLYKTQASFNIALTALWIDSKPISPDNKPYINQSFTEKSHITLTHKEAQSIRIEYSGLNYGYNDKTRYMMKLEGVDKKWQQVGTQHQVRFSNLPAGSYQLRIRGGEDGLNWDEKGEKILYIKVLPPFWLSGWAYGFYSICILLSVYFTYRYAKNRLTLKMRLKAEQDLRINEEKLNQQKMNFFAYVSHDLRTPLTLILSPLQRLLSQENFYDTDREKVEVVYKNANRMNFLIEELLTFSKIEMNQMSISVRKGNIMLFLNELARIFDIVSKEKEIDFIVNLEDTTEEVWFSPSTLERIMYNLLSNAFKYTQAGDFVQLTALLQDRDGQTYVCISVKDSGRGIPKEAQERIFENYYQVEVRDSREGIGLGLSLTKSLVHIHKGKIDVYSKEGEGANFVVTLNVSGQAYKETEKVRENITPAEIQKFNLRLRETVDLEPEHLILNEQTENVHKHTILIVEDNVEMNSYLKEIFSDRYNIIQTYNGEEAYNILRKKLPDLIISDVMMPVMDGLTLTELIKQDISTSHIPVILLTAKNEETDLTQGYLKGADAYISKPFNAQNLELLIKNMQKNRASNIERFKQASELNVTQITNNPRDEKFIKNLAELIMENIEKEEFGVTEITSIMGISRSLLHTKLKTLTGCSITRFLRAIKMKEAKKHLQNGLNVSEASFAVGISDPNYFTKCFKKEFDITPSEFIKQIKN